MPISRLGTWMQVSGGVRKAAWGRSSIPRTKMSSGMEYPACCASSIAPAASTSPAASPALKSRPRAVMRAAIAWAARSGAQSSAAAAKSSGAVLGNGRPVLDQPLAPALQPAHDGHLRPRFRPGCGLAGGADRGLRALGESHGLKWTPLLCAKRGEGGSFGGSKGRRPQGGARPSARPLARLRSGGAGPRAEAGRSAPGTTARPPARPASAYGRRGWGRFPGPSEDPATRPAAPRRRA